MLVYFLLIVITPFIYQFHINKTATAIIDKLQTDSIVANPPVENALLAKVMSSTNIFNSRHCRVLLFI
jgi:hypothetical protein